jgi:hypothetical protein
MGKTRIVKKKLEIRQRWFLAKTGAGEGDYYVEGSISMELIMSSESGLAC